MQKKQLEYNETTAVVEWDLDDIQRPMNRERNARRRDRLGTRNGRGGAKSKTDNYDFLSSFF